ncbi:kinase-like domain-containing protein [Mycena floridula]|nr:kinase-like domain-containing protein [Mycena floridula]
MRTAMANPGCSGNDLSKQVKLVGHWPIGNGASTDVYQGRLDRGNHPTMLVAIKCIRGVQNDPNPEVSATSSRRIKRESAVWSTLDHTNIQPYFGYCENIGPSIGMISPYQSKGTITVFLAKEDPGKTWSRTKYLFQIASGLHYLHSKGVVHGDLHCGNILIDDDGVARITDFGRARILNDAAYNTALFTGAPEYMAPELFFTDDNLTAEQKSALFTTESDSYAYAMVAFVITTGFDTPFKRRGTSLGFDTPQRIRQGIRPKREAGISDRLWSLMQQCWDEKLKNRPTSEMILGKVSQLN